MSERFQDKYRIGSHRLPGWDYSAEGLYFLTVNCYGMDCVFGDISNGQMRLNKYGEIATNEWYKSFDERKELFFDEFILMPNHWHAIVGISYTLDSAQEKMYSRALSSNTNKYSSLFWADKDNSGRKHHIKPEFKRRPKSISSFVAGYKSSVITKIDNYIDANNIQKQKYNKNNPLWQANYHDSIIRDQEAYYKIKHYIRNNPQKWGDSKLHK